MQRDKRHVDIRAAVPFTVGMGFYTPLVITNDYWHDIKADPDAFITSVGRVMNDGGQAIGATVLPARHADERRLIVVGGSFDVQPLDVGAALRYAQGHPRFVGLLEHEVDRAITTLRQTKAYLKGLTA